MGKLATAKLYLTRGDDESIAITVIKNGSPVNITGSTLFFTAKNDADDLDAAAVIKVKTSTHVDPVNGKSALSFSSVDTAVPAGTYVYDIQWVDASAKVTTILKGLVTVQDDVTKGVT